jgi:hypothetical protein
LGVAKRIPDGHLAIVEESDDPSDAAAKARRTGAEHCYAAASAAVHAVPEVAEFERSAMKAADASGGRARYGGIGPQEEGDGRFGVGLGYHTDERYEGHVWYEVDRRTGKIELTVDGASAELGREAERRVREACGER